MKNLITLVACTTVAAVAFGSCAWAGNGAEQRTVTVKYSVLDLKSDRGVARLYRGIQAAAENLCWTHESVAPTSVRADCVGSILRHTIATIDRPELNAYAAARGVSVSRATIARTRD
jgi:UrcA family protein